MPRTKNTQEKFSNAVVMESALDDISEDGKRIVRAIREEIKM